MFTKEVFGQADEFSIFVFNNHSQDNGNCKGRVAVGNTATYKSYYIGESLVPQTTGRDDLIIGQYVNIIDGENKNGNSILQSTATGRVLSYTMKNLNVGYPNLQTRDCSIESQCIDFQLVKQELELIGTSLFNPENEALKSHLGTIAFIETSN